MYFPDHLASSVAWCERSGADFVWSPVLVALPAPDRELEHTSRFRVHGVPPADDYVRACSCSPRLG